MELQPLKVNFYPKLRSKGGTDYTLYMRLILAGKRTDVSLDYTLKKESWDARERALSKKCPDRSYVLNLTNKYNQMAMEVYQQMIQPGMPLDVETIRHKITGNENGNVSVEPTLMTLFQRITERKKVLAGRNNSKATQQKYGRCKSHLITFLKKYYDKEDIKFNQLNLQFVEDFEVFRFGFSFWFFIALNFIISIIVNPVRFAILLHKYLLGCECCGKKHFPPVPAPMKMFPAIIFLAHLNLHFPCFSISFFLEL